MSAPFGNQLHDSAEKASKVDHHDQQEDTAGNQIPVRDLQQRDHHLCDQQNGIDRRFPEAELDGDQLASGVSAHQIDGEICGCSCCRRAVGTEKGDQRQVQDDVDDSSQQCGEKGSNTLFLYNVDTSEKCDKAGKAGGDDQRGDIAPGNIITGLSEGQEVDQYLAEKNTSGAAEEYKGLLIGQHIGKEF